ncbi:hypothetical protein [Streptomyces sp. NPDC101455]|uniref:hypothetical protein n=1 Tax=Streptomyces sp. NPDC101455 TaxID=3366142 RepID=UPI0037F61C1F
MTASLGTIRARMRSRLTGESHAQARQELHGPDGVPDASHPEQIALEAAVLTELHDAYAYEYGHSPLDGTVYGITRVRPMPTGLTLELSEDTWRTVMALLPVTDFGLDVEGLSIAGVPGLRVRPAPRGRGKAHIELFRPGGNATIAVQVPPDEAGEVRDWVARISEHGDPMHQAPQWTAAEQEQLAAYERRLRDPLSRSRVLRRLLAFRDLPRASVISDDGRVPTGTDFEQIIAARRSFPRRVPMRAGRLPRPMLSAGRPLLVAVVGTRVGPSGGQGRTSVTLGLAKALTRGGRRVMVVDGNAGGPASTLLMDTPEVPVMRLHSRGDLTAERLRDHAVGAGAEIVLLDCGPMDQDLIAEVADYWVGVTNVWQRPTWQDTSVVTLVAEDANGRVLGDGWQERWLDVMRAHRWRVHWRIAPGIGFEQQFAPHAARPAAGIIVLGERAGQPGARAEDYLASVTTNAPVAIPAVPYVDRIDRSSPESRTAYARLADALFTWPDTVDRESAL